MIFWKKKKPKPGYVYVLESTRKDGSKKLYVGKTTRSPSQRLKEHKSSVKSSKSTSWVGKGTGVRLLGAVYSKNPSKAEITLKKKKPAQKKAFARYGASKYKKFKAK